MGRHRSTARSTARRTRPLPFERGTDGPRVVLVGVDGTRTSRAGRLVRGRAGPPAGRRAWWSSSSARRRGLHRDDARHGRRRRSSETHDELAAELREECRRGAEELGLPVTFLCRRGDAYAELCAAADEFRADLVVVGSLRAGRPPAGRLGRHPAGPHRPLAGRRRALKPARRLSGTRPRGCPDDLESTGDRPDHRTVRRRRAHHARRLARLPPADPAAQVRRPDRRAAARRRASSRPG